MCDSIMAMPREDHLDAMLHMFVFLKLKYNSRLAFDPTYPEIDESDFIKRDWKQFYGDVKEAIPPNALKARGKEVILQGYCDSDHAEEKKTRQSRSEHFIFLNMALIVWFSKK